MYERYEWMRAGGIDRTRLRKSLSLDIERNGPGQYRVGGGDEMHWVDLYTSGVPRCDCGDHLWRDIICKHMLAALVREREHRVLRLLHEMRVAGELDDAPPSYGRARY